MKFLFFKKFAKTTKLRGALIFLEAMFNGCLIQNKYPP